MSYQTSYHYYQKVKTRYERMRAIAMFLAFAFSLSLIGLAFKDWRIAAGCYATALCYLPFFARGR
jgi:hypothetical protein